MEPIIGRLVWSWSEVATGQGAEGETLLRPEDFTIKRDGIQRLEDIRMERMRSLEESKPDMTKIFSHVELGLRAELAAHPEWREIVGYRFFKSFTFADIWKTGFLDSGSRAYGGFGFGVTRDDESTISWEWFKYSGPNKVTKGQETGEVSYSRVETPHGPQLSHMQFDTDVCVRATRRGEGMDPRNPHWRIWIRKGSEIYWPYEVNGDRRVTGSVG